MMMQYQSNTFSILCWNVQKRSNNPRFEAIMREILHVHPAQFILLQEARRKKKELCRLENIAFTKMSCNIRMPFGDFGVVTLSAYPGKTISLYRSSVREMGFATHKSALLTSHELPGGVPLYLLNLHAINFVSQKFFAKEIAAIMEILEAVSDALHLIVAGDFNTWSKKRMAFLDHEMARLGLTRIEPRSPHLVKSIGSRLLDHIYYKGLDPLFATAIDAPISDHNPLYATFRLPQ